MHRRCMLVAHDTSHVNRSLSAGTSTPEADSTASLIDLAALRQHLLNFLQHRWIVGHLQRTFLAPHHPTKPTSPPGVIQEWKARCRTETPLCGTPKVSRSLMFIFTTFSQLGKSTPVVGIKRAKIVLVTPSCITRTGLSPRCYTSASLIRFLAPRKQYSHDSTGIFEPSSSSLRPSPWCLSARPRP